MQPHIFIFIEIDLDKFGCVIERLKHGSFHIGPSAQSITALGSYPPQAVIDTQAWYKGRYENCRVVVNLKKDCESPFSFDL